MRWQRMARESNRVQALARLERPVDFDTLRRRALQDARGQVLREGVTYFGDGRVVPWCVRRSVRGRHDQFDVVAGDSIWRTAGRRKLPRSVRPAMLFRACRTL